MAQPSTVPHDEPAESDDRVGERFQALAARWKTACRLVSSSSAMVAHPAYRAIIDLGPPAVPLMLHELEREPVHWFAALAAVTGEDPVPRDDWGNVPAMAAAWVRWGKDRGIIGSQTVMIPFHELMHEELPRLTADNYHPTSPDGYAPCATTDLEPDREKVALYALGNFPTHAARQLASGRWTSKLGPEIDIEHDTPESVAGSVYGEVCQVLSRPRTA